MEVVTKGDVVKERITSRSLKTAFSADEKTQKDGGEAQWINQQRKAFQRWCNAFLVQRSLKIDSFENDLGSGVLLINLLELLAGKKLPNFDKKPKMKVQKVLNNQIALDWITKIEKLKLVGIGAEDIHDGNTKLILGLIWTLILRFQIQAGKWTEAGKKTTAKTELLEWVNTVLAPKSVKVADFSKDFKDGKAVGHLTNYLLAQKGKPLIDVEGLGDDEIQIFDLSFDKAESELGIPRLLDAADMEAPDELSVMTYVSYFRQNDSTSPEDFVKKRSGTSAPSTPVMTTPADPSIEVVVEAEGEGLSKTICGTQSSFTLLTKKKNGEIFYDANAEFMGTLQLPGTAMYAATITDTKTGKYTASYQVDVAGIYDLVIQRNNKPIRDAPYKVTAEAGAVWARSCIADGKGLSLARAGEAAFFKIFLRDKFGNSVSKGDYEIAVTFQTLEGSATGHTVPVTVKHEQNGIYQVEYNSEKSGQFKILVTVKGDHIKGSPFTVIVEADDLQPQITAEGEGLSKAIAGQAAKFVVHIKDRFGNVIAQHAHAALTSSLTGPSESDPLIESSRDGSFSGTYEPSASGTHQLHIKYHEVAIPGSPFQVEVAAGEVSASRSTAEGPGLTSVTSEEETHFVITTRDQFKNKVGRGGAKVEVTLVGPETVTADVHDNQDGTYTIKYKVRTVGQYKLNALVGGKAVQSSPFTVSVLPGKSDASFSTAEGDHIQNGVNAGELLEFLIWARDKHGNPVHDPSHKLDIAASGPAELQASLKQNNNGSFTIQTRPTKPGSYEFAIQLNGAPIKQHPVIIAVRAGKVHAISCTAEGEGLHTATAGKQAQFKVHTRDEHGNAVTYGGESIAATLDGGEKVTATVEDHKDGSYTLSYIPKHTGKFNLSVVAGGYNIKDSPFKVEVRAGKAHGASCTVFGHGISHAQAGATATFGIKVKDESGNAVEGAQVEAKLSGPEDVTVHLAGDSEGSYEAEYLAKKAGAYALAITVDGEAVKGSPFTVDVLAGSCDADSSTAEGRGIEEAVAGEVTTFLVIPKDEFGNILSVRGPKAPKLTVDVPVKQHPKIKEASTHGFEVEYIPEAAGTIKMDVLLNGYRVSKSPFNVSVRPGKASASFTVASGDGLHKAVAGERAHFSLSTKDSHGNDTTQGGLKIAAHIRGPAGTVQAEVAEKDGKYECSYVPTGAGDYELVVLADETPIKGSPFSLKVRTGEPSHEHSVIVSPTIPHEAPVQSGELLAYTLQLKDKAGNNVKPGDGDLSKLIEALVSGPESPVFAIKPTGDTVLLRTSATKPGKYTVSVKVGGQPIKHSPFTFDVTPGSISPASCYATGTGLTQAVAGEQAEFAVHTADKAGNAISTGSAKIEAHLEGPERVAATVHDNQDGTYKVHYITKIVGSYQLLVTADEAPIKESPFTVTVTPGELDVENSIAFGDGLVEASAGKPARFTVQPKDKFDNNLKIHAVEPEAFFMIGEKKVPIAVGDKNNDGCYELEYAPTEAGKVAVHVLLGGKPVKGSPFSAVILPGTASAVHTTAHGDGLTSAIANELSFFTIATQDEHGNAVRSGGHKVHANATGANGGFAIKVIDKNDGTYNAEFRPTVAGDCELEVFLNDAPIKGSPFKVHIQAGSTSTSNTEAHGDGLRSAIAGVHTTFTVTAKDDNGNLVGHGGDQVRATIKGPAKIATTIDDKQDGSYIVGYTAEVTGNYALNVKVGDDQIKNSPFTLTVHPGEIDPSKSTVISEGINRAVAGLPERFIVQCKDKFGNNAGAASGVKVEIDLKGKQPVKGTSEDKNDGTFVGSYTPAEAGQKELHITVNGVPVKDSPFSVNVAAGSPLGAQSSAEGLGLTKAAAGEVAHFVVYLKDQFANPLLVGGANVEATFQPSATIESKEVIDNNDGTYRVQYKPSKTGPLAIGLTVDGSSISGSPFMATVEAGAPSAAHTFAHGEGLSDKVRAGRPTRFIIQAVDAHGNHANLGGLPFVVTLEGGDVKIPLQVVDNKDGTYYVEYEPSLSGSFAVHVQLQGAHIKDSPYKVTIQAGEASAAHSGITKIEPEVGTAGLPFVVHFAVRDSKGNLVHELPSKAQIRAAQGGADTELSLTDNSDGTYTATHQTNKNGPIQISAYYDGSHAKGSPYTYKIKSGGLSRDHSRFQAPEGLIAGEDAEIVFHPQDEFGNVVDEDLDFETEFLELTNNENVPVKFTRKPDGSYALAFRPQKAGPHSLNLKLNGQSLTDKPFSVTIGAGKASPTSTYATGDGLANAIAGVAAKFTIISEDQFGNKSPVADLAALQATVKRSGAGGRELTRQASQSAFKGPQANPIDITIVATDQVGVYAAEYVPQVAGKFNVEIKSEKVHIKGSPYDLDVEAGAPDAANSLVEGSGLAGSTAGETSRFLVVLRDALGNRIKVSPDSQDQVVVAVEAGDVHVPVAIKNNDGVFNAEYEPKKVGDYKISVSYKGQPIGASPYEIKVQPNSLSAQETTAEGPGLSAAQVGDDAHFSVHTKDKLGNVITTGGANIEATLDTLDKVKATVTDQKDGTYAVVYQTKTSGNFKLHVVIDGKPISGSPFNVEVKSGPPSAAHSELKGELAATGGAAGKLTLITKDAGGNALKTGGAKVYARLQTDPEIIAAVHDKGDGQYEIEMPAIEKAGSYLFDLELDGHKVSGSPFSFVIAAGEAADGIVTGEGLGAEGLTVSAGAAGDLKVQALDKFKNALTVGGADIDVKFDGPSRSAGKVQDNGDGTYTVAYRVAVAGNYTGNLFISGKIVKSFNFVVTPGALSPIKSIAIGNGTQKAKSGEDAKFMIQSIDGFGNEIQVGGAEAKAFLRKEGEEEETLQVEIVDKQNGIYEATYQVDSAGRYILTVTLNGEAIERSPFTVRAVSGPSFAKKTVVKPISENAHKAKPGTPAFKFQMRDRNSNNRTKGGDDLSVYLRRPIRRPATVVDNKDGTYDISYPPGLERGEYELVAEVKGELVDLPNMNIVVDEADPLPAEEQSAVDSALPQSGSFIADILRGLDESKKKLFLADLLNLQKK